MNTHLALRIPIYGLGCGGGAAATIERQLARTQGVLRAYVNPATEVAHVDYDPGQIDAGRLVQVIDQAGYRAGPAVRGASALMSRHAIPVGGRRDGRRG